MFVTASRSQGNYDAPTQFESKVTPLLPAEIAAASFKAGLPMASLPEVVAGIATGNATLVAMAPGLTPAIAEAANLAAKDACKLI